MSNKEIQPKLRSQTQFEQDLPMAIDLTLESAAEGKEKLLANPDKCVEEIKSEK